MSWFTLGRRGRRMPQAEARARLTLPDDGRVVYAIGDVHGCLADLLRLEAAIVADAARLPGRTATIILLGDLVDRGPHSAGVIDHVMRPAPPGFTRMALAGNHERALLAFLDSGGADDLWLEYGGIETLRSYGVPATDRDRSGGDRRRLCQAALASIPDEHLLFLRSLPVCVRWGGFLFVHAGIRPGVPLDEQVEDDLTGIRDLFLRSDGVPGLRVIHGHTPGKVPELLPGRINIDTGAYATGLLTAVRVGEGEARILDSGRRA